MAVLQQKTGSAFLSTHPLQDDSIRVGRRRDCELFLDSKDVSRYHARIVSDSDGAIIEDLDSRNGITVNSQRARRQQLRSGDLIDLGRTQLRYIDLSEGTSGEGQA